MLEAAASQTLDMGSLHHAILRHMIERGYAPTRFELADHFDSSILDGANPVRGSAG